MVSDITTDNQHAHSQEPYHFPTCCYIRDYP
jgi:hypothetical protein